MKEVIAFFAVFLPLLGGVISGVGGPRFGSRFSQYVTCLSTSLSCVFSLALFLGYILMGKPFSMPLLTWFRVEFFAIEWGIMIDSLSGIMLVIVSFVSAMVHLYSIEYMAGDPGRIRFMSLLNFFTFFMLILVVAPNLLQLFFGWEGVGLLSYLLIGYWYEKESANKAAYKAFIINRLGDIGFLIGIFMLFSIFGTLDFLAIFVQAPEHLESNFHFFGYQFNAINLSLFLLFVGAMAKSAQLGFHTWLPDAMEGPTPVSALIHAATMVTAGVFLVVRLAPLYEFAEFVLSFMTIIGVLTMLVAALCACVQYDIKKIIAYSTCSQLGYMFVAAGLSAFPVAIFHLATHAFFKALLFLGAGAVIHAMSDEQDIRKMGGLRRYTPVTYLSMWIGSLSLMGVPFFSGYYSKDMILEVAWNSPGVIGTISFISCAFTALLTAFYSLRLLSYVFHGSSRADEVVISHLHEAPSVMLVPMVLLGVGAIFAGLIFYPLFSENELWLWNESLFVPTQHNGLSSFNGLSFSVTAISLLSLFLGATSIFILYKLRSNMQKHFMEKLKTVYHRVIESDVFDTVYRYLFVTPTIWLSNMLAKKVDQSVIDTYGPHGLATIAQQAGLFLTKWQTGFLYHYAFAMVVGILLIMALYL